MRIETVAVRTSDGVTLDAEIALPVDDPVAVVVMAHPHPRYGGDRHNAVVDAVFGILPRADIAVVRFDFRGVGRSGGRHDHGVGERLDVAAAADTGRTIVPQGPLVLAGYSFGALVALHVDHPAAAGWFAIAPPLAPAGDVPAAAHDPRPTHLVVPEHDQFSPPQVVASTIEGWAATSVDVVPMADHFLGVATQRVAEVATAFVLRLVDG